MKTLASASLIVLAGCAAVPPSEEVQTIEQFVADFSGRELRLQFPMPSDASTDASVLNGAKDSVYGYLGLKQAYAPAYKHCESGGGILRIAEQRVLSRAGANLPVRFQCRANDKPLWELGVQYTEKTITTDKSGRTFTLIPSATLASAADIANRRAGWDSVSRSEQGRQEKQKTRLRAEPAEKTTAEQVQKTAGGETLKLFRKNLKAGDRVQWKTGTTPAKAVGQVVRLDGDLALVRFDNQTYIGQSLRYFNRIQLEPFDGVMPVRVAR